MTRMNKDLEKRVIKVKFEVRDNGEGGKKLVGMPIVYERDSEVLYWFTESIARGAAKNALKNSDIRLLYGHNDNSVLPLARTSAGTMTVRETKDGVEMEADPPDTQFANDLIVAIERGDIQDMSFGFTVSDAEWSTKNELDHRTITEIAEIFDFSYVAFPAYPDTTAATRSFDKHKEEIAQRGVNIEDENLDIELLSMRARRL
jgi:HK97 family phage prohead protease